MPLPKTHQYFFNEIITENNKFFCIGNLLPDIDYFSNLSRDFTHKINFEDNKKISTMQITKGLNFHILLDQWWRKQIYVKSNSPYIGFELMLIYEKKIFKKNSKPIYITSKDLYATNNLLNYSYSDLENYFTFINNYFKQNDFNENQFIDLFIKKHKLTDDIKRKIEEEIKELENNTMVLNKLNLIKPYLFQKIWAINEKNNQIER